LSIDVAVSDEPHKEEYGRPDQQKAWKDTRQDCPAQQDTGDLVVALLDQAHGQHRSHGEIGAQKRALEMAPRQQVVGADEDDHEKCRAQAKGPRHGNGGSKQQQGIQGQHEPPADRIAHGQVAAHEATHHERPGRRAVVAMVG